MGKVGLFAVCLGMSNGKERGLKSCITVTVPIVLAWGTGENPIRVEDRHVSTTVGVVTTTCLQSALSCTKEGNFVRDSGVGWRVWLLNVIFFSLPFFIISKA